MTDKEEVKFLYYEDFCEMLEETLEAAKAFKGLHYRRETCYGVATFGVVACPVGLHWVDADITGEAEWVAHLEKEYELDEDFLAHIKEDGLEFTLVMMGELDGLDVVLGSLTIKEAEEKDEAIRRIRQAYDHHMSTVMEYAIG